MFHSRIHILKCDYGILNNFVDMGAIAMTGFFLLSGYVLNLSTRKSDLTQKTEMKKFYIKRLISILPLYYSWALINLIFNIVMNGKTAAIQEVFLFPIETLGMQTIFSSLFSFSHNGGSWFISCILICYFLYPLIQTVTKNISDNKRLKIIILLIFILLYSPFVEYFFKTNSIYSNPFFRIFEFSIGILVCQLNTENIKPNKIISLLRKPCICVLTIIILFLGVSFARYIGIPRMYMLYSWVALPCFISLLISLGYYKFSLLNKSKIISYFSDLSFSIFLSQLMIVWLGVKIILEYIGFTNNLANICLSFVVCFTIANLFHFCIEKPSLKYLKEKFLK